MVSFGKSKYQLRNLGQITTKANLNKVFNINTNTCINLPQTTGFGHWIATGLVFESQLDVLQVTAPGVPDFVSHPVGSPRIHMPEEWAASNYQEDKIVNARDKALLS